MLVEMEDTTDSESEEDEEDEKNPSEKMRKSHEKLQKVSNYTDSEDKGWKVSNYPLEFSILICFVQHWSLRICTLELIFYRVYKKWKQ